MRRLATIVLFVIGGFCVGMQVMIGFVHVPPDAAPSLPPLLYFSAIALLFLIPATGISPGRRWLQLGLTLLTGAAVCVGSFALTIADPSRQGEAGVLESFRGQIDWGQGWTNLSFVVLAGLLLIFFELWGKDWT